LRAFRLAISTGLGSLSLGPEATSVRPFFDIEIVLG